MDALQAVSAVDAVPSATLDKASDNRDSAPAFLAGSNHRFQKQLVKACGYWPRSLTTSTTPVCEQT